MNDVSGVAFGPGSHAPHEAASASSPPVSIPNAEPDEIVWLRDLDGTGSMHVCTPHDPGAIRYCRMD
jgi:hypothetical protein